MGDKKEAVVTSATINEERHLQKGDYVEVKTEIGTFEGVIVNRRSIEDDRAKEVNDFAVYVENVGRQEWFNEKDLTLIQEGRGDLLQAWKTKLEGEPKTPDEVNVEALEKAKKLEVEKMEAITAEKEKASAPKEEKLTHPGEGVEL